jgi:hypothetical protein
VYLFAGRSELRAQSADVHHDSALVDLGVTPDFTKQAFGRDYLVAPLDQVPQQIEFAPRQDDRDSVDFDKAGVEIRFDASAAIGEEPFGRTIQSPTEHFVESLVQLLP